MDAEFDGLECLAPVIERRRGGETGARRVKFLEGAEVWRAGEKGEWSWPLLAAALSRSDSPQGDPVKDGRTQDLAGLGLVPKLATAPRVFLIEHLDGFRSAVMALDGVVADYNFATSSSDGVTWSAQIYRAPLPAQHHYSLLAEVMERYFRGEAPLIGSPAAGTTAVSARDGAPPWSLDRGVFVAGLIEAGRRARQTPGSWVETPGLKLPGRA